MNRRARPSCVLGTLVLGMLLVLGIPSRAAADPAGGDRAQLAALLRAGASAARARKWDACIESYSKAVAIEEAPTTFGELGLCEEAAGRYAAAHPHLRRAVAGMAPGAGGRAGYQAALGRVVELVAIVFVTLTPTDAHLVVDGRPYVLGDGKHVVLEPGRHVFSARREGYEDASKTLPLNAGDMPNVELVLDKLPDAAAAPPAEPPRAAGPAPAAPARPAGPALQPVSAPSLPLPLRWCVPAWSARGVLGPAACTGVVALAASAGAAIGLTVHWQSMRDSLVARGAGVSSCYGAGAATAECRELLSRQEQRDTAQDVLIGAAIATGGLMGMAAIAIAVEPLGPRITAAASPNGGGIAVQGTW